MWIRLLSTQRFDLGEGLREYHPGAWLNINRRIATDLIAEGQASTTPEAHVLAQGEPLGTPDGSGVCLTGSPQNDAWLEGAVGMGVPTATTVDRYVIAYPYTLCLTPMGMPRWDLWARGFGLVERFDLAVPIVSLKAMAVSEDPADERDATALLVHDLRVPLYDPAVLFLRQSKAAQDTLDLWYSEPGENRLLSFLRAVYKAKPLILALPPVWRSQPTGKSL